MAHPAGDVAYLQVFTGQQRWPPVYEQMVAKQMNPLDILNNVFGYESFRPLQREVVDAVIAGGNALALMPTGGGKSICY